MLTIDSTRLTLESYTSVLMDGHPLKSSHSLVQPSTGLLMAICGRLYLISSSQSRNIHPSAIQANVHVHRASKDHTGTYLAGRVSECLHEYGIHGKVSALLCRHYNTMFANQQL
jgi:hypothetical protein